MAYQNISFPVPGLIHDFKAEPTLPTNIVSNYSNEYRINRYANSKTKFTFPSHRAKYSYWVTLLAFLETVGYQRDSFNFTRPDTGAVVHCRFDNFPGMQQITLDSNNLPVIVNLSDITLIQVFNEP